MDETVGNGRNHTWRKRGSRILSADVQAEEERAGALRDRVIFEDRKALREKNSRLFGGCYGERDTNT